MDPLESIASEMLRTRPAITAAEGVRSTATYTEVPKFGLRDARLTVVFIARGDRRWGRFWGSITCFMFPPGGRAMETRLSYVLRPRSHELTFTLFCGLGQGEEFGLSALEVASGWSPSILRLESLANALRTKQGISSLDQLWNRE